MQIVFQDPTSALNPRQTIYESVAEGLRIHGVTSHDGLSEEQLVARALARSGLRPPERFYLVYPHELSGGQRQRVVIAGALVLDPEIIVADEPVSSLDASVRGEILKLLLGLRDDFGIAMLVVTHDLGLAWTIADRVAVMYLGRIVEIGPAEDVLDRTPAPVHQGPARGGARSRRTHTADSCPARRPTRPASPRAAASIPGVPNSSRARRDGRRRSQVPRRGPRADRAPTRTTSPHATSRPPAAATWCLRDDLIVDPGSPGGLRCARTSVRDCVDRNDRT